MERDPVLEEIFEKAGGQAALARELSTKERPLTRMAVNQWTRVPDHYVRTIHEMYGISLRRMRPEILDPNFAT